MTDRTLIHKATHRALPLHRLVTNLPELLVADVLSSHRVAIIVEDDRHRYLQFLALEDGELLVETVSNRFLEAPLRWSDHDERLLREIGFGDPEPEREPRPNWWWSARGAGAVLRASRMAALALSNVFRLEGASAVALTRTVWRMHPPTEDLAA